MDAWFEIFKDDVGEYRFRLTVESVGGDEITATSEGYKAKHNAVKGIETGGKVGGGGVGNIATEGACGGSH